MTSTHWLIRAQVLLSTMAETVADVDDIIVGASGNDSGHTAWILMSCALVNFMTPGLAFFYGGLVRRNHVLSIIIQNYVWSRAVWNQFRASHAIDATLSP